jgi:glycosyltransferase involved in cell wall biosynthesis
VDELAVNDAVHFIGQREDVPAVFRALDVSLLPSWDEPFGLAAVESLAMGTPAFVTSSGGAAEAVKDGVAGRVLPAKRPELWADALRQLLSDSKALGRMGDHGRELAELQNRGGGNRGARNGRTDRATLAMAPSDPCARE